MIYLLAGEGEAAHGPAFEGVIGAQVLASGIEVRVPHELLDRDDVAAFFEEARSVGVTEFVQSSLLNARELCD